MEMIEKICALEALNDLFFVSNKKSKEASIHSIISLAADNDVVLYPLQIPKSKLANIEFPYIIFFKTDYGKGEGHFSLINDKVFLDSIFLNDTVIILTDKLPKVNYRALTEQETRSIKGSKKKTFFGGLARNVLPQIGMGMIPGVGPLLATGYGAWRGARKGGGVLGGLAGAAGGYGLGGLGAGLRGGISGLLGRTGFGAGFGAGVGGYGGTTGALLSKLPGMGEGGAARGMLPTGVSKYLGYAPPAGIPQLAGAGIEATRAGIPTTLWNKVMAGLRGEPGGIGAPFLAGTAGAGIGAGAIPGAVPTVTPGVAGVGAGQVATEAAKRSMLQRFAPYLGTALLAGSAAVPTPEYPEFPDIGMVGERTRRLLGEMPGAELRTAAQERLLEQIRAPLGTMLGPEVDPYSREAIRLHTESYDQRKEQIDQMFNYHGAFGSGEHRQALMDLEEEKARGISQLEQESLYRGQQLELDIKTTALASALGVSESDARTLMAMLEEETAREMGIYREEAGAAGELQDILGTAGGTLLSRALLPQQQNILDLILRRGGESLLAGRQ